MFRCQALCRYTGHCLWCGIHHLCINESWYSVIVECIALSVSKYLLSSFMTCVASQTVLHVALFQAHSNSPPPPPLGHIWDVMLVWRKGNIEKTVSVLWYCVLLQWCTKIRAVLTGRSTVSGFDLAWFSSLPSTSVSLVFVCIKNVFCLHPSLYLLVGWAWWDWPLTSLTTHHPSVLRHCWLGHVTRKTVSEMTYNVSSGTLNSTIQRVGVMVVYQTSIHAVRVLLHNNLE